MRTLQPRASRGMRQVTAGLRSLDDEVFDAIANSESPLFDKLMPALSRAADHALLWFAIAAAMATSGDRSPQHAAAAVWPVLR